jgi:ribosome recycling factor
MGSSRLFGVIACGLRARWQVSRSLLVSRILPCKVYRMVELTTCASALPDNLLGSVGAAPTIQPSHWAGYPKDSPRLPHRRSFTTTTPRAAKGRKDHHNPKKHAPRPEDHAVSDKDHTSKQERAAAEDPFDMNDLEAAFAKAADHHTEKLKQQRAGGRFNADTLGSLRVKPDKDSSQTYPLSQLATIAHRGGHRVVTILAHEAASIKPIMSAVQSSPSFNQQPQRNPDNELELTVRIQAETRDQLVAKVKETCLSWRDQVRAARQARLKMQDKWSKQKMITTDDKARLDKEVEKQMEQQLKNVTAKEKEALAQLEKVR